MTPVPAGPAAVGRRWQRLRAQDVASGRGARVRQRVLLCGAILWPGPDGSAGAVRVFGARWTSAASAPRRRSQQQGSCLSCLQPRERCSHRAVFPPGWGTLFCELPCFLCNARLTLYLAPDLALGYRPVEVNKPGVGCCPEDPGDEGVDDPAVPHVM